MPPSSRIPKPAGPAPWPTWRELARRHPMTVTVLLSLLLHAGGLAVLGFGLQPSQTVVAALEPESEPLRFELIETSASAEVDEPRDSDSRFVSDRNTRSQERSPDPDLPRTGSPRITQDGEGHDLRQVGTAPRQGSPSPATAPPIPPGRPSPPSPPSPSQPPRQETRDEREPTPATTGIQVRPEAVPDALPPEPAEGSRVEEPREEPLEEAREKPTPRAPAARPRPPVPPTPVAPPADQATPPTAFRLGERVQPGRPSLSEVEQDLLARAEAEGEISFEATQHFFADYFLRMRRKIENTWVLLLSSRYKSMDPSRSAFEFLVQPDGSVTALTPIEAEGDELFPLVCGLAVRNAGPFDPVPYDALPRLPDGVRDLPLRVRVTFNYQ